jgi:hypothetical protein
VVAQPPHGLGLPAHTYETFGVEVVHLHDGHGHVAVEAGVARQVHALACALAQEALYAIAARAERLGQRRRAALGRCAGL